MLVLLLAGCGGSDEQPKEKAEQLAQQGQDELNKKNYDEAERLLVECINLYSESNNEAKLAEHYATLSSVQLLAGKLSPALETLTALRELYRYAADRTAELQAMFQLSMVHVKLGNTAEAVRLLQEAFSSSSLYRLNELHAQAGLEAGKLFNTLHQYEKALVYLRDAYGYYRASGNWQRRIETNSSMINAMTAIHNTSSAYSLFQETESLFSVNDPSLNRSKFYCEIGNAFSRAGDFPFARANYLQAISILNQQSGTENSEDRALALLGLGEIYYSNFSFPEAQQYFVAAYTVAKNRSDQYIQAYLLMRIADCLMKASAYRNAADGMIRSSQLYEQAFTLFARVGFGLGEAIATHRLGILKELSGDESAAITFYKRAYEKYLDNTMPPEHYLLPIPVQQLYHQPSRSYAPHEWFSERLLGLLLKFKRFSEALTYHETVRSIVLQHQLAGLQFNFREPEKRKQYSEYIIGLKEKFRLQLELYHLQNANRNYAAKIQQRLKIVRSKVESDAITLMREYPVFSFIGFSQQTMRQMFDTKLTNATIVIDYCFAHNELWAFVIRPGEEVSAVKITSFGGTLSAKMDSFMEALNSSAIRRSDLIAQSEELYGFLLKPFDNIARQKLIIIPPMNDAKFPFHALMEKGKFAIESQDITYLPHVLMINSKAHLPRFVNNVVTFGFTPDYRWGLEFELRDTRSFFQNAQVHVNQQATMQKLENALGEVLQIASLFTQNQNKEYSFTVSDGSSSKAGVSVPVTTFASLHPFQIVYLSHIQTTRNDLTELHPMIWLLNGSASIIATQYPVTSAVSKSFGEHFYSSLSSEINPSLAYRRATVQLGKKKELREGFGGASYFYYGVK